MSELWLPVKGYEGLYEVSDHGQVCSLDRMIWTRGRKSRRMHRGRLLRLLHHPHGYPMVNLYRDGVATYRSVHTLMLEAFVGPRPEGMVGCHKDDNPRHNLLPNLRWDTHAANTADSVRNGTHRNTAKRACKRGHLLIAPNLVGDSDAPGRRRLCRACGLAHTTAGPGEMQERSDRYYAEIMAGTFRGAMGLRTACPRAHALVAPNLVRSTLEQGRRACLACARARGYLQRRPGEEMQAVADRYYAEIMGEAA